MARLRGAETVIVGIQPDVAFAIVQLGMDLEVRTALDLEEGLICLEAATSGHRIGQSTLGALDHGQRGAADTKPPHLRSRPDSQPGYAGVRTTDGSLDGAAPP